MASWRLGCTACFNKNKLAACSPTANYLINAVVPPNCKIKLKRKLSSISPNQVFYNTKVDVDGEDNGPQRDGALRQPGRSSERVVSVR